MKITFNVSGCGLENNGGSITIIKSANTLVNLGHEVTIIDHRDNEYTWGVVKAKHKIVRNKDDIPNADVIIATGFSTVRRMLHWPKRCGKKFHWIRGWEIWNYPEWYIKEHILHYPVIRFVNSIQLRQKLVSCGIDSYIIRPGYDFDEFSILNIRNEKEIVLGGLYCNGKKRNGKRTEWIIETAKKLKEKYKIKLWMFGQENNPGIDIIDRYFKDPTPALKNEIYNVVNIWLAPTGLEGLHMPPAEAMLTSSAVVGTNAELTGMVDYLVHEETGLVAGNTLDCFVESTKRLINCPGLRKDLGEAGRLKVMSLGSREDNMEKMIEALKQNVQKTKISIN